MKPFTHTLNDVFGMDTRYVVPLYQRPYVWQQESHWEPLWEDVLFVLDSQAEGHAHSHFMGAIVLEQLKTAPGAVPEWLVIDGQQRLTTLQLLLAAAANTAGAEEAARSARLLSRLVHNSEDMTEGDHRFKVWPTNANRPTFRLVMQPGGPPAHAPDDPDNQLQEAYAFFAGRISEWAAEEAGEVEEVFDRLRVTLTSLLKIVSINLEEGDNAQVIFETLNARGTPLLAMDLVKNAMFHRATNEGADADALHDNVWLSQLGKDYWRVEVRQGRLIRPRAEIFLMHWLAMKLGKIIPATELFGLFRTRILDAPAAPNAEALIYELSRDAGVMRELADAPRGTLMGDFMYWLGVIDITTPIPVALLLARGDELEPERKHRAIRALESFFVRRMILGLTAKNYSQLAARLIEAARRDLAVADDAIVEELRGSEADAFRWPSDEEIVERLTTRPTYHWIKQSRIVALLAAVELAARRHSKVEDIYELPRKLSIEHILPREWRAHWPAPDDPEARDALLDHVGNLTLVSGGLNSSMSNAAWETKKAALVQNSLLLTNQRLASEPEWTDAHTRSRDTAIAEQLCDLWPEPSDELWSPTDSPATSSW